jgi:hypothetical protein
VLAGSGHFNEFCSGWAPHEELHLVFFVEHHVERLVVECDSHQRDALFVVKGRRFHRMPAGGVVGIAFKPQPFRPSLDVVVEESLRGTAERIESHDCECVTQIYRRLDSSCLWTSCRHAS